MPAKTIEELPGVGPATAEKLSQSSSDAGSMTMSVTDPSVGTAVAKRHVSP